MSQCEQRPEPLVVARRFLQGYYSEFTLHVAFVAGSVFTGEGTPTSDLDVVVIADHPEAPFRSSHLEEGWPLEVFTHSTTSYRQYFASDRGRRQPSLPHMCATGHSLVDTAVAARVRCEALELLEGGPEPLSPAELDAGRYLLTDLLDDLEGATCPAERFLITAQLALAWPNFVLEVHRHWGGQGKWALRQLERSWPGLAREFAAALAECRSDNTGPLVALVDRSLEPMGGRLFAGYRALGRRQ